MIVLGVRLGEMEVWVRRPEADVPRQKDRRSQTGRSTFPDLEANVPRPGGRRFQFGRLWSVDVFIDGD